MEILKYFFDCYFNQTFGFDELNERVNDFKKESVCTQQQLVKELEMIIQKDDYFFVSDFLHKNCDSSMGPYTAKKFIYYLYNKLINKLTKTKATDSIKKYRLVFCPICTPDPEIVTNFGIIDKGTIIANDMQIYTCKSCQLVWLDENDIRADNAISYKEFRKAHRLTGLWNQLKNIDIL
jgi:transposase-like protein